MDGRFSILGLCVVLLGGTSSCGGLYYTSVMHSASARLEQARALGADKQAPFEYYYAKAHFEQAQVEAAEASYGDAASFARTAEEYAAKAVDLTQSAARGTGKP